MKEMYVKPLVEKIVFDGADVIATSSGDDPAPTVVPPNNQNANKCSVAPNKKNANHCTNF